MTSTTNRISRRSFLRGTAATLVLVAGGTVYRAFDQGVFSVGQGPAYEPWTNWRDEAQSGALNMVRAAILAASPHNMQSWLFRVAENQIDVFIDTTRNIGKVDPFYRELCIGVGCAIENLTLAAAPNGYAARVSIGPDPANRDHAARIDLTRMQAPTSPLYEVIPQRRTNRAAYDTSRQIAPATLAQLAALNDDAQVSVFWFATPEERKRIGDATVEATRVFNTDAEQSRDSDSKFRASWDEIQHFRDGLTIDPQPNSPLIKSLIKMVPYQPEGAGASVFLTNTEQIQVPTAAAFGLLAVRDGHSYAQRLGGGRLWQRMHLWATTQGLAMQPLNQLCERADREADLGIEPRFTRVLAELIGDPSWQALMPFRLGYPTIELVHSPRRAVEDVLR